MSRRRPGLWVEIALTLALITLATIVLNGGVTWLVLDQAEEQRRTEHAVALGTALGALLEVEAGRSGGEPGYRRVVAAYQDQRLGLSELWVVDPSLVLLAGSGQPPRSPDAGLRSALYGKEPLVEVQGGVFGDRRVVVTVPIARRSEVAGAARVALPLENPLLGGNGLLFAGLYALVSAALVALFGLTLFRRGLLRPIEALRAGTTRIATGEFGARVEIDAARELEELCDALNAMSASLADYRDATTDQLTRLEQANAELRRARDALVRSEKLAGVGRLAAGLAHELGNPLAAAVGFVDLLALGDLEPAAAADMVARTRTELARIQDIIGQLLGYSRVGEGVVEDVDVAGVVAAAVATVEHQPALRLVALAVDVADDLPPVRAEPDKLHQVLVNLLLNAADAVAGRAGPERSDPVGSVAISAGPTDGGVRLSVVDDGPGFSEEALQRAFEPFFTTKDVGEGTGLGLATSLMVIEAAGGRIDVSNRPAGGGEVSVWLPAVVPPPGT